MSNAVKRALQSPFTGISILVTLTAALFFNSPLQLNLRSTFSSFNFNSLLHPRQRLFSAEELALYNGTDDSLPILLGILGSVFDVTKGRSHYGVGGGYNHFAGRDPLGFDSRPEKGRKPSKKLSPELVEKIGKLAESVSRS